MNEAKTERPWEKHYEADRIRIAVETPLLRVLEATFAAGQQVPWHGHTNVVDHFWVISGRLRVETRAPDQCLELGSGGYCAVGAGCEHRVTCLGDEKCHFVNLQGFGTYDFLRPKEHDHSGQI